MSLTHANIKTLFSTIDRRLGRADWFPPPISLTRLLSTELERSSHRDFFLSPAQAMLFCSAAVEIWHRSVHSFLISLALFRSSDIWASVAGYYASHYVMRAYANVLGHQMLFVKKWVIEISLQRGRYICTCSRPKNTEHQHYWSLLNKMACFSSNVLFVNNAPRMNESDAAHRGRANYGDHLNQFKNVDPVDKEFIRSRAARISNMAGACPPIPNRNNYPDVDAVQVVAYARIVSFRDFLDDILGNDSRFWRKHRTPEWSKSYVDFQLVKESLSGPVPGQ